MLRLSRNAIERVRVVGVATLTGDDILRMPEIGIEIPVAEFYVDIDFQNEITAGQ